MKNNALRIAMLSLSTLALAACNQSAQAPLVEATANDHQGILAAEHLAELSFDEGDFETHMGLWAEDTLEFVSPFGSYTDASEYETWIKGFYDYTQQAGGTRHHVVNPIVIVTGDTAEVTAYLHVVNRMDGSFMGSSVIRDRLIETPGGWRFTYRSVEPDQTY
jgi:SnoaL-like domain